MPDSKIFPAKDADFSNYANQAIPYLTDPANAARLNVSDTDGDEASRLLGDWNIVYRKSIDANASTSVIKGEKNRLRTDITDILRTIYDNIPKRNLTPADRGVLHLKERSRPQDSPVPTTAPEGSVNTSQRLRHTISFHNTGSEGRAKPKGVRGCQIWYNTTADAGQAGLTFLALDTASPYTVSWGDDKVGKNIYYWLRWENTRGEEGPWSEVLMATVTG